MKLSGLKLKLFKIQTKPVKPFYKICHFTLYDNYFPDKKDKNEK